jgi:hypothetical protein
VVGGRLAFQGVGERERWLSEGRLAVGADVALENVYFGLTGWIEQFNIARSIQRRTPSNFQSPSPRTPHIPTSYSD